MQRRGEAVLGKKHFQIHLLRKRGPPATPESLGIIDLEMREQAMALLVFLHLKIGDRREPLLALCSEAFNVGLAEIFLRPVLFADHVSVEEAGIILLR